MPKAILRTVELLSRFKNFQSSGDVLAPSHHPNFPTQLWLLGDDDAEIRSHIVKILRDRDYQGTEGLAGPLSKGQWLGASEAKSRLTGVCRFAPSIGSANEVWQFSDEGRTRQSTSVMGRFGVVSILAELLGQALDECERLNITDVARLAMNLAKKEDEGLQAKVKCLRRLNAGFFVNAGAVNALAQRFQVPMNQLCFDHPAIYEKAAWDRGKTGRLETVADRERALKNHRVRFSKLSHLEPEAIRTLVRGARAGRSIQVFEKFDVDNGLESRERHLLTANFAEALLTARSARKILDVLLRLQEHGVAVWIGNYSDIVPADPASIAVISSSMRFSGEAIDKTIVAFREVTKGEPLHQVDLAHTIRLGPTLRDLWQQLND